MAKIRFLQPGDNVVKLGTKNLKRRKLIRNILITMWIVQTLITLGFLINNIYL